MGFFPEFNMAILFSSISTQVTLCPFLFSARYTAVTRPTQPVPATDILIASPP